MVHTNLLCDCCCTVAVRTRIHHDQTCIAGVHTRIAVVSVAVSSSSSKQSKKHKKLKCGIPAHKPTRIYTHARTRIIAHPEHTPIKHSHSLCCKKHEHGLLHATHSSCWCCCCGSALWWRRRCCCCSCCCVPASLGVERNKARLVFRVKQPPLPKYFTAAEGTSNKKPKNEKL